MIAVIITCLYSVENLSTGDVENHYKEGLSSKVKRNNVESVDKIC